MVTMAGKKVRLWRLPTVPCLVCGTQDGTAARQGSSRRRGNTGRDAATGGCITCTATARRLASSLTASSVRASGGACSHTNAVP
jgi:hypothetical protein